MTVIPLLTGMPSSSTCNRTEASALYPFYRASQVTAYLRACTHIITRLYLAFYIIILPLLILCVNRINIIFLLHSFKSCELLSPVNSITSAFNHTHAQILKIRIHNIFSVTLAVHPGFHNRFGRILTGGNIFSGCPV